MSCTTQLLSDDAYRVQDILYLAVLLVLHLRHGVQDREEVGGQGLARRCGRHLCCSAATRRTAAAAAARERRVDNMVWIMQVGRALKYRCALVLRCGCMHGAGRHLGRAPRARRALLPPPILPFIVL